MPNTVYTTPQIAAPQITAAFLATLLHKLPIGTNLALAQLLFVVMAGYLIQSRGALLPALLAAGLDPKQSCRAMGALREGAWSINPLLQRLSQLIQDQNQAQPVRIGPWRPLLLDWLGFFRPRQAGCFSKHFDSQAGKALAAIELGMIAEPLQAAKRRFPSLRALVRGGATSTLLLAARRCQKSDEVLVIDRQARIKALFEAGIARFVIRGASNIVAYRREVPPQPVGKRGRKPTRGERVRPIARTYKGKPLPLSAPDAVECFLYQGRQILAQRFHDLVVAGCPLTFCILVMRDPKYKNPWLLLTDLQHESAQTIFLLYRSRWLIEVLPLSAKQLLGAVRSFVHALSCQYRLPELCLLAASICLYLSATLPAVASGFWDKNPQPTVGRFRRVLSGAPLPDWGSLGSEFSSVAGICARVRQKRSVHWHLRKGVEGNRRYRGQRAREKV